MKGTEKKLLATILAVLFLILLIRTAWVSDDAYISLRTISNFARGQGLTWNVGERVQSYTHPLWLILLGVGIFFTNEFFLTTIALSMLTSLAAYMIFCLFIGKLKPAGLITAVVLLLSKAFVDYSTSGLENPLNHLLLVLFCVVLFRYEGSPRTFLILGFLASLSILSRPDNLLIFFPAVLAAFLSHRSRRHFGFLVISQLPLLLWEGFSLVYYGSLIPNTAIAKLNVGLPRSDLVTQGWLYLLDSIERDPITLFALLAGLGSAVIVRSWKRWALAGGIALHLIYIVSIGGDFMSGRFLTLPLLCGAVLLSEAELENPMGLAVFALFAILGFSAPFPPFSSGHTYGQLEEQRGLRNGIMDERGYYYPTTGLLRYGRNNQLPVHPWVFDGIKAKGGKEQVVVTAGIGFFGFYAGPDIYIVDYNGLADPLLARLPARLDPEWRVGHFGRSLPAGYLSSLREGENLIADPALASYYEALRTVTRANLFSRERLRSIWLLNTGGYDGLLMEYLGRSRPALDASELSPSMDEKEKKPSVTFNEVGIELVFTEIEHGDTISLEISNHQQYSLIYLLEGVEIARQVFTAWDSQDTELFVGGISLPTIVQRGGFNGLIISPSEYGQYEVRAIDIR